MTRIKARVGRYWPRPAADREAFRYARSLTTSDRRAAVRTVIDQLMPRARHGQRAVGYALLGLLLTAPGADGYHRELGRDYLAAQAGVTARTVTSALMTLRRAQLLHTPVRGRHGQGCSIMATASDLLYAVVDAAKAARQERKGAGYAKLARRNIFQCAKRGTNDTPPSVGSGVGGGAAGPADPQAAGAEARQAAMAAVRAILSHPPP